MNPHQQVLQISKPMWIVMAVVMGVGVLGKFDEPDPSAASNRRWQGSYISQDLTVTRLSNQPIEFPDLGLVIEPIDDWVCLSVADQEVPFRHTFVNEKSLLIARLTRFPYTNWPPTPRPDSNAPLPSDSLDAKTDLPLSRTQPASARQSTIQVDSDQYEHVSIDWIRLPNSPTKGAEKLLGRIETDSFDALLTVIDFRQQPQHAAEVKTFCNHIKLLVTH